MQNQKATSRTLWILLIICLAQAAYIYTVTPGRPAPDRIASITPIGEGGAIYEVEYNSGGATVPLIYRYFVINLQSNEPDAIQKISHSTPFLITQAPHAVREVTHNHVKLMTEGIIYSYHNTAHFKSNDKLEVVTFELSATLH